MSLTLDALLTATMGATGTTLVGATILHARASLGWEQRQLAAEARLSAATVSRAERGQHSTDTVLAVAAALPPVLGDEVVRRLCAGMDFATVPDFAREAVREAAVREVVARVQALRVEHASAPIQEVAATDAPDTAQQAPAADVGGEE